jgi:hypothetical protein
VKRDLYAKVWARIVAELERGAAPWVKPWSATPGQNVPQNAVTNRPYSGCNVILLWLDWLAGAAGFELPHPKSKLARCAHRARLVRPHQRTVAGDVRRQNRREPAWLAFGHR